LFYQKQYKSDIENYVNNQVVFYKKEILSSYNRAAEVLISKKQLLKKIHTEALKELQNNPDMDLMELKRELTQKFHLEDLELNIFLINRDYIIYKTTFAKDLGLNLGTMNDAKEFLDKTTKDSKIYISNFLSTDSLDMKYKFYATSLLKDGIYLETGIADNKLKSPVKYILEENKNTKNKIKIYTITEDDEKYVYSDMESGMNKMNKTESIKDRGIALKSDYKENNIIKSYLTHKTIAIQKGNIERVFVPFFDADMYSSIGWKNVVMQLDVDISSQVSGLKRYETIFFTSAIIIMLFLVFIFFLVQNNFTKPIEIILKSINKKEPVKDTDLLQKSDELGIVAKEYNTLVESLKREIVTNAQLLNENKRFIADTVHQIRTPLTNIMMNSDMVKLTAKDNASDEFIEQINSSINMLTNSYEDLSYIISHDSIIYTPVDLCMSDMLKGRISFFMTIAKVNHKVIVSNIEEGIRLKINQVELERLVDNNISNAVKYADTNTTITINLSQDKDTITLSFSSYAEAIKNSDKLFEKNYRENESKRGLGLGLNMVKSICEKYAVAYWVDYIDNQNIFVYEFKV
jgi:signal transduction histidine kinase